MKRPFSELRNSVFPNNRRLKISHIIQNEIQASTYIMKTAMITVIVTLVIGGAGCKKNNSGGDDTNQPPPEKKWIVSTVAGNGTSSFADGPVFEAGFASPDDIAVTPYGTLYVADGKNHRIRKISGGEVSTFAGMNKEDTSSGLGSDAGFILPIQLAADKAGNLYTLDGEDPRVRKINPSSLVSVLAGSGEDGFADGNAGTAKFGKDLFGIVADGEANIYVADETNHRIRKITGGQVSTVAGNGMAGFVNGTSTESQFFSPTGIVVDKLENLFVADWNRIRKIAPDGVVSTFAGSDSLGYRDGSPSQAGFVLIGDMVIDETGNLYVSDGNRIRKITKDGFVSTIAGSSAPGYADGEGSSAKFRYPNGLGIDKQGNIYVADTENHRIRELTYE